MIHCYRYTIREGIMQKMKVVLFFAVFMASSAVFSAVGIGESEPVFLTSRPPAPPQPVSPANHDQTVSISKPVVLAWHTLPHAAGYTLEVSPAADFQHLITHVNHITDTCYTVTEDLDTTTVYYWRVRAQNVAGTGRYSPVWQFSLIFTAPEQGPELYAPGNAVSGVSVQTDLKWYAVQGAGTYRVQVSALPDFSTLVFESPAVAETWCQTENLEPGTLYFWRVLAQNSGGPGPFSSEWMFTTEGTSASGSHWDAVPDHFALMPAHPNPFNPSTTIGYEMPEASRVTLTIYNSCGQSVRTLTSGFQPAGAHTVHWNGCDHLGFPVTSGLYICCFEFNGGRMNQKMMLMR